MDNLHVSPVKLRPIPTPRLWGGHHMKAHFGADHVTEPVGEYWLVSAHPQQESVVVGGDYDGWSLSELTRQYPEAYLGTSPQPRFPLLIKLIEAETDLSVQVHPDDTYAQMHANDFGKTEAWYILDAPESGRVVYGHHFRDRADYLRAVAERRVADLLDYRSVQPGDTVYVPSGTLHALLGGTTLIEVQQTSDVTYRVYDWDRVDASGQPRALHVERAADVLRYEEAPAPLPAGNVDARTEHARAQVLLDCPYFRIERWMQVGEGTTVLPPSSNPSVVVGVSGVGRMTWQGRDVGQVGTGDAWLIPTACSTTAIVAGDEPWVVLRVIY
ncbi:mannose-6-phosphate isomerase, class I [Alicyclobacillus sp. ALC3]|uniref:mannose-6-phosphate isomerase, class I n=1 Tax=Alicyclobacillus sp. ALC3 TaxID=2796143 RepID=UPI002379E033|nr:mannose-6-phosphate isomerase, class I [Alicyclobacillus sp. ALC3]WDL97880.1 mannose-6-phosphate isomerase, class I [Alicyclobacillus sp. ALC3]